MSTKKNNSVIDTNAKVVSTEIVKRDSAVRNDFCKKISTSQRFGFGIKSILTAVLAIIVSVFSFLFFGLVVLIVFAIPFLVFSAIRFLAKKR
jgi:uncharacterized membrane protein